MKLRIIIISVFSFLLACSGLKAQNIEETYRFANQHFDNCNYRQALAEFQRVAFFDAENQYLDIYQKIADSFLAVGEHDRAVQNYTIAIRIAEGDSLKTELIFKKVNCFFQQGNYLLALNEILGVPEPASSYLENKYLLYLATSYFGNGQYENSFAVFEKLLPLEIRPELAELFADFAKFQKRFNPKKIQIMSMILPGSGQIFIGEIGQGLNSILLLGGIATASVFIFQYYGIVNAVLSTGSWYYRYYRGGYMKAKDLAQHKLEHEKEDVFQSLLILVENNISQEP